MPTDGTIWTIPLTHLRPVGSVLETDAWMMQKMLMSSFTSWGMASTTGSPEVRQTAMDSVKV